MSEGKKDSETQYFEFTDELPCASALFINGTRYQNAAAKFWPRLIDEIRISTPKCTTIELSAMSASPLEHSVLFPELALEDDISKLWDMNLEDVMRETTAELNMLGPPSNVNIRLLQKEESILETTMPPDCLDSETFQYFVAWLMQWSSIVCSDWNNKSLESSITGEDKERDVNYLISFSVLYEHISEGLHRRTVKLAMP